MNNTSKIKICRKCYKEFFCNKTNISNCQCNSIILSEKTITFLLKTSFDCLCIDCLSYFNDLMLCSDNFEFPIQKESLIEGIHYYIENGNFVFKELYHLQRGNCCKSGCRHCVYGFTNTSTIDD